MPWLLFSLLVKEIPFFDKYFDLIFERFGSEGLKSARFELIQDGITKFLIHPLGGLLQMQANIVGIGIIIFILIALESLGLYRLSHLYFQI